MLYILKVIISAILIVIIAEIAKRSALFGSIVASIPLVSLLAMIWLYNDTKDAVVVSHLSKDIFWMVLPSLALFITLPIFIKYKMNFYAALSLSSLITVGSYFLMIVVLKKIGIIL